MTYDFNCTLPEEFLEPILEHGLDILPELIETLINAAMQIERQQHLGIAPYERSSDRRGYANGYKPKTVATRLGKLTFQVPQVREGDFYPNSLEKGIRSERALKLALAEMYVQGVSTRRVAKITEQLCGFDVSSTQVSQAAAELDEQLEAWRQRPLGHSPYLWLDAHYEKVRQDGQVRDAAVLKAVGLNEEGMRMILGVSVALSEHEAHWRAFLKSLVKRGLAGVCLVISDDHQGLGKARRADIRAIFNAPDRAEAEALLARLVAKYEQKASALSQWMETNIPEGLTVFDFPANHQRRIRTANGLERLNREVRRRSRVAVLFPNVASCERLVTAVLMEISEEWETGRTYLRLEDNESA